jgi:aspartate racemase
MSAPHIGIIGVSPEGAALFHRRLAAHARRLLGPHDQPIISVHSFPLTRYLDAIRRDDWPSVAEMLSTSARMLAQIGADVVLTPDNAVQHGVYLAAARSPIPWISMVDLVAERIERDAPEAVGIIGSRYVTAGSTYQTLLGLRGVRLVRPNDSEAAQLDDIIFNELINGFIRDESSHAIGAMMDRMEAAGANGVIMACSESPLILTRESGTMPIYDAADILAERVAACAGRGLSKDDVPLAG